MLNSIFSILYATTGAIFISLMSLQICAYIFTLINFKSQDGSFSLMLIASNGHGCMLQYALLHLAGYAISIDDLKKFRVSYQGDIYRSNPLISMR